MQQSTIPDIIEFVAAFNAGPQCSVTERVARGQMRGLVNDAVAAFEITIMPDDDLLLACDALRRDIADLEYPPCADGPHDPPAGESDLDIAATTRKRCYLHGTGGRPREGNVVRHLSLPMPFRGSRRQGIATNNGAPAGPDVV